MSAFAGVFDTEDAAVFGLKPAPVLGCGIAGVFTPPEGLRARAHTHGPTPPKKTPATPADPTTKAARCLTLSCGSSWGLSLKGKRDRVSFDVDAIEIDFTNRLAL